MFGSLEKTSVYTLFFLRILFLLFIIFFPHMICFSWEKINLNVVRLMKIDESIKVILNGLVRLIRKETHWPKFSLFGPLGVHCQFVCFKSGPKYRLSIKFKPSLSRQTSVSRSPWSEQQWPFGCDLTLAAFPPIQTLVAGSPF